LRAQAVRKRLITLHLYHSNSVTPESEAGTPAVASTSKIVVQPVAKLSIERGIELLVEHLDTVYTDAEGWQQLADIYASMGLCVP
jgi:hypothetical protein